MFFFTHLFRVCYFSTLVKLLSGYLLFAANLEDFHTIAKKLGAENFPKSFIKNAGKGDAASYEDADYERSFEIQQKSHHSNSKKHSNLKPRDTKIDFDELVERVKKRIEKELKEKYHIERDTEITAINNNKKEKDTNNNTKHKQEVKKNVKETSQVDYDTEYVDEIIDIPKKPFDKNEGLQGKIKKTTKAIVEEKKLEYADATIEMTTKQKRYKQKSTYKDEFSFETVTYTYTDDNDRNQEIKTTKDNLVSKEEKNLPFKKILMSMKDSYEDYKIPEKETNIYSSTEIKPQKSDINEKRFNIKKQNRKKIVTKDITELTTNNLKKRSKKTKLKKSTPNDEYIDKFIESEEIKAKTVYANFDEMSSKENTKRVKSVTNKPTRERYKAVTPNYYAKLPTVVEKYDFNEPLPEKDRERENLKYYGNPPALINKKVRLL